MAAMQAPAPTPISLDLLENWSGLWLRPVALLDGAAAARACAAGMALPLAGGGTAFGGLEVLVRRPGGEVAAALAPLPRLRQWAAARGSAASSHIEQRLAALSAPRPPWAGMALDPPLVMGIVNVTPDSFADGGAHAEPEQAIAHGQALLAQGADIIDVGGESTRPGARPVSLGEERRRVEPVIRALAATGATVSVDTSRAPIMAAAIAAGARIVNDTTALAGDPASLALVATSGVAVVLMHMQGEPRTMQDDPHYDLASLDVLEALAARVAACEAAGIERRRILVDPGIGFGKSVQHNLEILARIALFHALGCGVLVGLSRKSFIGRASHAPVEERLPGSLAGAVHAVQAGVQILRVHDVAATRQAIVLWLAIAQGS